MAAEECLVGAAPDYKGRIGSINSTLFTYDYIGSRVLQRSHYVSGGNINVNYAYDNLGRVTDIASSDGTIDFDYTYAAGENNIDDIAFNHRTSTPSNDFVYDNLDRLYSVEYLDDDTDTEAFTMDLLGNRESVTIDGGTPETYAVDDATNRYDETVGSYDINLAYDTAGNTTTDQNNYVYTYDYENRIETITRPSDSSTIVTYTGACPSKPLAGNALGRRIKMVDAITAANSRYYYFSDNWQVLEEYSVETTPVIEAYYVWGGYIDELVFIFNADNSLFAHVLHDHLFSPVALVNPIGTVLERYEYNAYGKPTVYTNMNDWQTGTPPTTQNYSEYGNPYTFTGRRLDILDGGNYKKYHYRHRDYDALTGRFLQKDPHGMVPHGGDTNSFRVGKQYMDGTNLYGYVGGRPVGELDPMGTRNLPVHVTRLFPCYKTGYCKGNCGPDISYALMRTNIIVADKMEAAFADPKTGKETKKRICGFSVWSKDNILGHPNSAFSYNGWGYETLQNIDSWEWPDYPSGKNCENTVRLHGHCYNKWEVNYFMWGLVNRVCGNPWSKAERFLAWASIKGDSKQCKKQFALAGYHNDWGRVWKACQLDACCKTKKADGSPWPHLHRTLEPKVGDLMFPSERWRKKKSCGS